MDSVGMHAINMPTLGSALEAILTPRGRYGGWRGPLGGLGLGLGFRLYNSTVRIVPSETACGWSYGVRGGTCQSAAVQGPGEPATVSFTATVNST